MAMKSKNLNEVRESVPVTVITNAAMVRVNLNVPPETRDRWKIESIKRGVTLAELITEAVEAHIKHNSNE